MPAPLPLKSINHIGRVTRDLDASLRFYCDVLGFEQVWRPDFSFPGAWLFNYGLQIHLIAPGGDHEEANREIRSRVDHVAFYVDSTDEVERLLKEHDVPYRSSFVKDTGVTQLFFLDPDGNHIEVGTYPPTRPRA